MSHYIRNYQGVSAANNDANALSPNIANVTEDGETKLLHLNLGSDVPVKFVGSNVEEMEVKKRCVVTFVDESGATIAPIIQYVGYTVTSAMLAERVPSAPEGKAFDKWLLNGSQYTGGTLSTDITVYTSWKDAVPPIVLNSATSSQSYYVTLYFTLNETTVQSARVVHSNGSSTQESTITIPSTTGNFNTTVYTYDGSTNSYTLYYTVNGIEYTGDTVSCYVGECFIAGTKVLVGFNGETKNIEDIVAGDQVIAHNMFTNEDILAYIEKPMLTMSKRHVIITLADGSSATCSVGHPLYSDKGWVCAYGKHTTAIDEVCNVMKVGDKLYTQNGFVEVSDITFETGDTVMYSLDIEDRYHTFYANGILALETQMKYFDLCQNGVKNVSVVETKDDGDKVISDIVPGDFVKAKQKYTGEVTYAIAKSLYEYEAPKKLVELTFEDGAKLVCGMMQCIMTKDGWKSYMERNCDDHLTEIICVGDEVLTQDGSYSKITKIRVVKNEENTYCIDVDDSFDNYFVYTPSDDFFLGGGANGPQQSFSKLIIHNVPS